MCENREREIEREREEEEEGERGREITRARREGERRERRVKERLSELVVREMQHISDCKGRDAYGHGGFG